MISNQLVNTVVSTSETIHKTWQPVNANAGSYLVAFLVAGCIWLAGTLSFGGHSGKK